VCTRKGRNTHFPDQRVWKFPRDPKFTYVRSGVDSLGFALELSGVVSEEPERCESDSTHKTGKGLAGWEMIFCQISRQELNN